MPDLFATIENVTRTMQDRLEARTAYGQPVSANGVTVIPVARVAFGFGGGGGGGTGMEPQRDGDALGEAVEAVRTGSGGGGGGGGGGQVQPLGFIEITDDGARWVPLEPSKSEMALRALMAMAVIAPVGGRGGLLRRLLLVLAGQAVVAALSRPKLPPLESMRFSRTPAETPA